MIKLLGLSERQPVGLVSIPNDYISKHKKKNPAMVYGIRKYVSDTYRIFCMQGKLRDYHSCLSLVSKYDVNYSQSFV